MTDSVRYRQVAEEIRRRIGSGAYAPTGGLESEAELGRRFGVSRVTVRKALEHLRDEGIVVSRKGSGWRVAVDSIRQVLGAFPTVEAALRDDGVAFRRHVLDFAFRGAPDDVAAKLAIATGDEVLRVRRINYADDHVFDVVTSWVRAEVGAPLSRAEIEQYGVFGALRRHGVATGDVRQSITAALATAEDARHLGVARNSPLLVVEQTTAGADATPVKFSEHRYPAHRIHLEVLIPGASATAEPAGLRLLRGRADDDATRQSNS